MFSSLFGGVKLRKVNAPAPKPSVTASAKRDALDDLPDLKCYAPKADLEPATSAATSQNKYRSAPAKSSTAPSPAKRGTLEELIFAQDPRGFWEWKPSCVYTQASAVLSSDRLKQVEALLATEKVDEKVFATAVALVLLE